MRLKTMPRKRMPNYLREITNAGKKLIRSTDITQDVNEQLKKIGEYGRILGNLKIPETRKYEVPENSGNFHPMELVRGNYVEGVGLLREAKRSTEQIFGVLNLSTKDGFGTDVNDQTIHGSVLSDETNSSDDFSGSLLYKIMTDPNFVETIKNNKEMKKLTCEFCKKKFSNDDELQDHLDSRMNKFDRISCCACSKTFRQKRYLRYHQRCHLMNNKFTCEICLKKYSRMDNLTRHKTYHTNPNKYPCKICNRKFSRRDLMTKHSRSHDVKKMNCYLCEQVFADFAEMKTHMLASHTSNYKN